MNRGMDADVAVIGLGIMGSATLWRAAARGARVIGFEQFEIGHTFGSSHGESRIIRTAIFEGPMYSPLVQQAFTLWRQLERESGASLLTLTGALMIGAPQASVVAGALRSAAIYDLPHESLDTAAMQARYPQHRVEAPEMAMYEAQAGFLRPERAVAAAVAAATAHGVQVQAPTAVRRIVADETGVLIETPERVYRVGHAVVAAGSWVSSLLADLPLPLAVTRQVLGWFPMRRPERLTPDRFPIFIREFSAGHSFYGFPTLDGATVKVAMHDLGVVTSPQSVDRTVHADDLATLQTYIATYLPDIEPTAVASTVCLYTNTPDRHFVIDHPPAHPNVTVLSCCSGHGFKYAAAIGDIATDLALEGATERPIDAFALRRFAR